MPRVLLVILAVAAGFVVPHTAAAQRCVAPPGTAAVDQYCETVPTAEGDRGSADPPPAKLAPETVAALNRTPDGQALAQVLGQDAATGKARNKRVPAVTPAPASDPFSAITQAIGDGSTIGTGFIIALIIIALLMAGWGWVAYRRRSAS
jgi:hypothetical protein